MAYFRALLHLNQEKKKGTIKSNFFKPKLTYKCTLKANNFSEI